MRDDERQREAKDALERVAREAETIGTSSLGRTARRVGDHFAGRDAVGTEEAGATDSIEVWGRRIGRLLSLIGVAVLLVWFGVQRGWW